MKKMIRYIFIGIVAFSLMAAGCGGGSQPPAPKAAEVPQPVELNISAAVSLKDA